MSLRLTILNAFFRAFAKPRLRRTTDPAIARRDFAIAARLFLARGGAAVGVPGHPAMQRHDPPGGPTQQALLYFHGGGYVVGSPTTHRGLASRLVQETGLSVWLPEYRLAPDHAFPAAWDDADRAWAVLLGQGHAPDDIVLAGESAGGGLAFALLARLCAAGTPPAGVVAFSPWVDLTGTSESLISNKARDPLLPAAAFGLLAGHVLAGHPADDPRASPLFAAYPGCPPVLLQASDSEILRDDTVNLAGRLRAFGAAVTLQMSPDTPHGWHLMVGRLPEADRAVQAAGLFVRSLFQKTGQ
ncbi:MAG: alpha/beta hydrolase [Rhodobacteraceae bacterium]|jgi:epsilon-lactone hydrolase|nr:alpha/beta hydrolase [Paracoccaceae bacterium]